MIWSNGIACAIACRTSGLSKGAVAKFMCRKRFSLPFTPATVTPSCVRSASNSRGVRPVTRSACPVWSTTTRFDDCGTRRTVTRSTAGAPR
jgi:hypothetical protein